MPYIRFRSTHILAIVILLTICCSAIFVSCSIKTTHKPIVTVSIQPQRYLLEQIVGDNVEVRCLLANGGNPETYEPSLTHLMNLEGSDAYFQIGNVGFESAIIDRIRHNNPNLKIVNVSGGIDLIYGTHSDCENDSIECQHSHEVDPHVWSSVRNCKIIAINMLNAMTEIDPTHANVYKANCSVLVNHLDSLDAQFANMLSKKPLLSFMVWHPSLSYFARDYNLKQISIGIEGKEISIQRIQEKIDEAKTYNATVFFAQKDFDSRQASIISKETGAIVVDINLLTYDWEKELYEIATTLAAE